MKQFEILRELLIYDTETQTEQMLLGKWQSTALPKAGYHQPAAVRTGGLQRAIKQGVSVPSCCARPPTPGRSSHRRL